MDPSPQKSEHQESACLKDAVLIDLQGSDVTLISCDGAKFRVHQCILSLASPFFGGVFNLTKSPQPTVKISMDESASVLETIIRFIYPTLPQAELATISQAKVVLEAAHKLTLPHVEVEVRRHLRDMLSNESNPLRAWALAVSVKDDNSRQSAMLRFLYLDDDQLPNVIAHAIDELPYVSAVDYALLLEWRIKAVQEARAIAVNEERVISSPRRVGSFQDIYGSSVSPFILWDHPSALVHAWLKCEVKIPAHASRMDSPKTATDIISQLRQVIDRAKGQRNYPPS